MGLIKFLKPVKSFCFFQCNGDSFPYDRSRVLKSKFAYVSSNLWSVEIKLGRISGVIGVDSCCRYEEALFSWFI